MSALQVMALGEGVGERHSVVGRIRSL